METFSFPMMEVPDIVAALNSWNLSCNENDFKQPKRERWQEIYIALLSQAVGCDDREMESQLSQTPFDQMEGLDYPLCHEYAMPLFNLTRAMHRVQYACGLDDFNVMDIIEPKPRRLIRLCSAMINFINFRIQHMETYEDIKAANFALKEQRETLIKENDLRQKKINSINMARAEQEPEVKKVDEEIEVVTDSIENARSEATALQKKTADVKAVMAAKKADVSKLKEAIAAAKERANKLSSQIVQSPERMKGESERMTAMLSQLQMQREEKKNRLQSLRNQKSNIEGFSGEVDQALQLVKAVADTIKKEKEKTAEIGRLRSVADEKKGKLREVSSNIQLSKRAIVSKQEKRSKLELQHSSKTNALKEQYSQVSKDKEKMLLERSADELEVLEKMEAMDHLKAKVRHMQQQHADVMTSMRNKYDDLLTQVNKYHEALGEKWEKCLADA